MVAPALGGVARRREQPPSDGESSVRSRQHSSPAAPDAAQAQAAVPDTACPLRGGPAADGPRPALTAPASAACVVAQGERPTIDPGATITEYLDRSDWRVNANANQGYSWAG